MMPAALDEAHSGDDAQRQAHEFFTKNTFVISTCCQPFSVLQLVFSF